MDDLRNRVLKLVAIAETAMRKYMEREHPTPGAKQEVKRVFSNFRNSIDANWTMLPVEIPEGMLLGHPRGKEEPLLLVPVHLTKGMRPKFTPRLTPTEEFARWKHHRDERVRMDLDVLQGALDDTRGELEHALHDLGATHAVEEWILEYHPGERDPRVVKLALRCRELREAVRDQRERMEELDK